jgi:hypothetical protein
VAWCEDNPSRPARKGCPGVKGYSSGAVTLPARAFPDRLARSTAYGLTISFLLHLLPPEKKSNKNSACALFTRHNCCLFTYNKEKKLPQSLGKKLLFYYISSVN